MRIDRYCPGCGRGKGNQSCAIAKCSLQYNNVEYCFLCPEYPCPKYDGAEEYDSFITHQRQLRDMARIQEIGIEAYNEEQTRKAEVLQTLLSEYNDGRRKTFYCVAVNLLPLHESEDIMNQLAENPSYNNLKEKAESAASLFRDCADRYGLVLKLRKKKGEK